MAADEKNSGFEFPCVLPVKAMGRTDGDFVEVVVEIISRHSEVSEEAVRTRESGSGNFLSVTIDVTFHNRDHMERVYKELHAHEAVLWTL